MSKSIRQEADSRPEKGRVSVEQYAFGAAAERFGCRYAVARSVDQAQSIVDGWLVSTKRRGAAPVRPKAHADIERGTGE